MALPSSLLGQLTATPSSGSLAAGQSAQVTVTVGGLLSAGTQIPVSPGQSVTVLLGIGAKLNVF